MAGDIVIFLNLHSEALCLLLSLFRYGRIARQLNKGDYHYAPGLLYWIVSFILLAGIVLIVYLVMTT